MILDATQANSFTTPTNWNLLLNTGAAAPTFGIFYKTSNGAEGATVSVTSSTTCGVNGMVYQISGWSGTPEQANAGNTTGASDPPSYTPSWGAADTLWIACQVGVGATVETTAPTNYTGLITAASSIPTTNLGNSAAATRQLNAATENPGTFAANSASGWKAATIAVKPVLPTFTPFDMSQPLDVCTDMIPQFWLESRDQVNVS